jgi:hypothetical protein
MEEYEKSRDSKEKVDLQVKDPERLRGNEEELRMPIKV